MLKSLDVNLENLKTKANNLNNINKEIKNAFEKIIPCVNAAIIRETEKLSVDNVSEKILIKGEIRQNEIPVSTVAYFHKNPDIQKMLKDKIETILSKYDYISDFSLNFYLHNRMVPELEGYISFGFVLNVD